MNAFKIRTLTRTFEIKIFSIFILFLFFSSITSAKEIWTFQDFLKKVQAQNPELKIEGAKLEVAQAKSTGIRIPSLVLSGMQVKPENSSKITNGFEIMQLIPFPTKISNEHSSRKFEAKSQEKIKESRDQEILAKARYLYFSLWASQEEIQLLEEKKKVITAHVKLSQSMVRSDSFIQIHLLKAESDLDLLTNEIFASLQKLKEKEAEISAFLGEDPANFSFLAKDPSMSEIPKFITVDETFQVQSLNFKLKSFISQESEAKASWFPDFFISYKQIGAVAMMPPLQEIKIGITLPFLYFWESNSKSSEFTAKRLETEFRLEKERRDIQAEKLNLDNLLDSLKKQIEIIGENLIPRGKLRIKLFRNIAPRDLASLQEHLDTMVALPNLKLQKLDLRTKYEKAISELAKYGPK